MRTLLVSEAHVRALVEDSVWSWLWTIDARAQRIAHGLSASLRAKDSCAPGNKMPCLEEWLALGSPCSARALHRALDRRCWWRLRERCAGLQSPPSSRHIRMYCNLTQQKFMPARTCRGRSVAANRTRRSRASQQCRSPSPGQRPGTSVQPAGSGHPAQGVEVGGARASRVLGRFALRAHAAQARHSAHALHTSLHSAFSPHETPLNA